MESLATAQPLHPRECTLWTSKTSALNRSGLPSCMNLKAHSNALAVSHQPGAPPHDQVLLAVFLHWSTGLQSSVSVLGWGSVFHAILATTSGLCSLQSSGWHQGTHLLACQFLSIGRRCHQLKNTCIGSIWMAPQCGRGKREAGEALWAVTR